MNQALSGRSFFEAYPQIEIKSPFMLDAEAIRKDQIFLQSYPYILSPEEIVLIHREDAYKAHRFLDFLGLEYSKNAKFVDLIETIRRGAYMPVLYLKLAYKRPRPYEVMPNLATVLDRCDLPSYPSLAATENRLIAHILGEVMCDEESKQKILQFSEEMNERRVLAGVSYPSDVTAGVKLAEQMKDVFMEDDRLSDLIKAVQKAIKQAPKNENVTKFEKSKKKLIKVENMPLETFVAKIQSLSKKKINLDVKHQYYVSEEFEERLWKVALDLYVWDSRLAIFETDDEIYITEN